MAKVQFEKHIKKNVDLFLKNPKYFILNYNYIIQNDIGAQKMSDFKLFSGGFVTVSDQLFPEGNPFYKQTYDPMEESKFYTEIERDLPRISYLTPCVSNENLKTLDCTTAKAFSELLSKTPFEEGKSAYIQGSFEGAVFSEMPMKQLSEASITPLRDEFAKKEGSMPYKDTFSVAYIDDNGIPCAFSISYRREDPYEEDAQTIPIEKRQYSFVVTMINHTNEPPDKRQCFVYASSKVLSEKIITGKDVNDQNQINENIKEFAHSAPLIKLLSGLIENGTLSITKFKELKNRMRSSQNLDDKDFRTTLLKELIDQYQSYKNGSLDNFLKKIEEESKNTFDFFESKRFQEKLNEIYKHIRNDMLSTIGDSADKKLALKKLQLTYIAVMLDLRNSTNGNRPKNENIDLVDQNRKPETEINLFYEEAQKFRNQRDTNLTEENPLLDMEKELSIPETDQLIDNIKKQELVDEIIELNKNLALLKEDYIPATVKKGLSETINNNNLKEMSYDDLTILKGLLTFCLEAVDHELTQGYHSIKMLEAFENSLGKIQNKTEKTWSELSPHFSTFKNELPELIKNATNSKLKNDFDTLYKNKPENSKSDPTKDIKENIAETAKKIVDNETNSISNTDLTLLNNILKYCLLRNEYTVNYYNQLNKIDESLGQIIKKEGELWNELGSDLLKLQCELMINKPAEYDKLLTNSNDETIKNLREQALVVINENKEIVKTRPTNNELSILINILKPLSAVQKKLQENKYSDIRTDFIKITELSQTLSEKTSPAWKHLGAGLLIFAGLALIVIGLATVIPSLGASIMAIAAGTAAISAGIATAASLKPNMKPDSTYTKFKSEMEKLRDEYEKVEQPEQLEKKPRSNHSKRF